MREITVSALVVAGIIVGVFIGREYFSKCDAVAPPDACAYKFSCPALPDPSTFLSEKDAHNFSVTFRKNMKYCEPNGACAIDLNKEGYFEVAESTVAQLYAAITAISSKNPTTPPRTFRCIFGEDATGNAKLMVVGLYVDASGKESELVNAIIPLTDNLPCPKLCDLPLSQIIFGTTGKDACNPL